MIVWINIIAVLASAAIASYALTRIEASLLARLWRTQKNTLVIGIAPTISLIGFAIVTASPALLILTMVFLTGWCARSEVKARAAQASSVSTVLLMALVVASLLAPFVGAKHHTALDAALALACMGGFFAARKHAAIALGAAFTYCATLLLAYGLVFWGYSLLQGATS